MRGGVERSSSTGERPTRCCRISRSRRPYSRISWGIRNVLDQGSTDLIAVNMRGSKAILHQESTRRFLNQVVYFARPAIAEIDKQKCRNGSNGSGVGQTNVAASLNCEAEASHAPKRSVCGQPSALGGAGTAPGIQDLRPGVGFVLLPAWEKPLSNLFRLSDHFPVRTPSRRVFPSSQLGAVARAASSQCP